MPATAPDFFTVFALPRYLHVDTEALEKSFYAQSRKLHPDRFAAKSAEEQDAALASSSRLNDAYRTLKDPILRTQYLLTLQGVAHERQREEAAYPAGAAGRGLRAQHAVDGVEGGQTNGR